MIQKYFIYKKIINLLTVTSSQPTILIPSLVCHLQRGFLFSLLSHKFNLSEPLWFNNMIITRKLHK